MASEAPFDPAEDSPAPTENPPEATPVDLDADTPPLAVAAEAAVDDDADASPTVIAPA